MAHGIAHDVTRRRLPQARRSSSISTGPGHCASPCSAADGRFNHHRGVLLGSLWPAHMGALRRRCDRPRAPAALVVARAAELGREPRRRGTRRGRPPAPRVGRAAVRRKRRRARRARRGRREPVRIGRRRALRRRRRLARRRRGRATRGVRPCAAVGAHRVGCERRGEPRRRRSRRGPRGPRVARVARRDGIGRPGSARALGPRFASRPAEPDDAMRDRRRRPATTTTTTTTTAAADDDDACALPRTRGASHGGGALCLERAHTIITIITIITVITLGTLGRSTPPPCGCGGGCGARRRPSRRRDGHSANGRLGHAPTGAAPAVSAAPG